jgi:hypothetical protein
MTTLINNKPGNQQKKMNLNINFGNFFKSKAGTQKSTTNHNKDKKQLFS